MLRVGRPGGTPARSPGGRAVSKLLLFRGDAPAIVRSCAAGARSPAGDSPERARSVGTGLQAARPRALLEMDVFLQGATRQLGTKIADDLRGQRRVVLGSRARRS